MENTCDTFFLIPLDLDSNEKKGALKFREKNPSLHRDMLSKMSYTSISKCFSFSPQI
jgi:hypothetical protein